MRFIITILVLCSVCNAQDYQAAAWKLHGGTTDGWRLWQDGAARGIRSESVTWQQVESFVATGNVAAVRAEIESARQAAKPLNLKQAENNFFGLCQYLGMTGKPGFPEIQAKIDALMATDPNAAVVVSLKLLATDAACKREGGNLWWDDAAWHPEIVQ